MRFRTSILVVFSSGLLVASVYGSWAAAQRAEQLWALQPLKQPEIPKQQGALVNPIDAFLTSAQKSKRIQPLGRADKRTLLRRVTFDLAGIPPTLSEQEDFLSDESIGAYERVVDRLLSSEQHGVRYGRHWLDVLRYADVDENMPSAASVHLWRDWVITALNRDMPYDAFVRAQISGYRSSNRSTMSATGYRSRIEPRPDDWAALGFLARGAVSRRNSGQEMAFAAVETISTAFMGMTVGCAKCHDHFYDPISQSDYYSMKALFDPLELKSVLLATPEQIAAYGTALDDFEGKKAAIEKPLNALVEPYRKRLFEERVAMLPPEVQRVIRKSDRERTAAEQKIADDYFPILRIDPPKLKEIMPAEVAKQYDDLLKKLGQLKRPDELPALWTVEENAKRALEKSYVLTSGDPERPQTGKEVSPGFPFAPAGLDFREGRRETFVDWLTAPESPLFARVAVNRIWQWHFGSALHRNASDFGTLGGEPVHRELLDWLASEFVAQGYRMKWLHRLIVTSEAYRRVSAGDHELMSANRAIDPENRFFWHFRLRRLEAEAIWDAIFSCAGTLDVTVGGKSFQVRESGEAAHWAKPRRGVYMSRGYHSSRDVMPPFLQVFDVEDGRTSCARRNETVTAPQALLLMNDSMVDEATARFADRLWSESEGNLAAAIELGYRIALNRLLSVDERQQACAYVRNDSNRLKGFAWLLFNLDEFIYVR